MRRIYSPMILTLTLLIASGAHGASLDRARDLYDQGSFQQALEEARTLLDEPSRSHDHPEALHLAGIIAVELQDYASARSFWIDLTETYPESDETRSVKTELALVSALLATLPPQPPTPAPPAPSSAPAAPATPDPAPEPPVSAIPAPTVPVPAVPATDLPSAAATPAPPAAARPNLVLVAGRGKPYDAVEETNRRFRDWMLQNDILVESATEGLAVVQDSDAQLAHLLQVTRETGAGSLLFVIARYGTGGEGIKVECYAPDGSLLWKERVKGGTGWTGQRFSKTRINEALVERILEKLESRVGGPGLPTG